MTSKNRANRFGFHSFVTISAHTLTMSSHLLKSNKNVASIFITIKIFSMQRIEQKPIQTNAKWLTFISIHSPHKGWVYKICVTGDCKSLIKITSVFSRGWERKRRFAPTFGRQIKIVGEELAWVLRLAFQAHIRNPHIPFRERHPLNLISSKRLHFGTENFE